VEEFEHIPWSHLVDDHRSRRTRAMYAVAALVAAFAVGTAIARTVFGGGVPFSTLPAVASVGMGICVASLASLVPVCRAASIQPGPVLRGE